jgi:hypothetical protein
MAPLLDAALVALLALVELLVDPPLLELLAVSPPVPLLLLVVWCPPWPPVVVEPPVPCTGVDPVHAPRPMPASDRATALRAAQESPRDPASIPAPPSARR